MIRLFCLVSLVVELIELVFFKEKWSWGYIRCEWGSSKKIIVKHRADSSTWQFRTFIDVEDTSGVEW